MLSLKTDLRIHHKKNATRKLRKQNKCPAVIYGNNYENITITLNQHTIQRPNIAIQLYKNNIILLKVKNHATPITVKIQTIQYHPYKFKIIHIDFLQI